ncbi:MULTISPECIES: thiamine phosphate synthase [Pseudoxanthomonas]|uniref:Thiamine-phosphate synthase n=1 Tax=Pseudoxanthomonas winnipegensis TaxID=2480810 RepID=A0AAW8GGE1_9GAMM|nr:MULTISPECIES: thiamine phosphate synthase [Pseudoxanthomonas]MDQ1120094.1 thiamine-phosphate pyrophosphorylase [Pseudoxanthomonas winnipegensis]MDQ1133304.1 thiamine-phosphate pyrophosphorylase [Pseudoxanthomonas winnipegensis]MDR6136701.1 thiamine-phosphate pyrophosphorylase [Pseudoxanthomonas sp. SORGH_AS_0997]
MPASLPRGLYLLTPDLDDDAQLLARVRPLLDSGAVTWLQYRNKSVDDAQRARQAAALLPLCRAAGVPLIINDDAALAVELGAAGLHREDATTPLAELRAALGPDALLGASCYDQPALAYEAVEEGASYVSFGAFFASRSKPGPHRATTAVFDATAGLGVPRVAIGGLTPANAGPIIAAGADLVAAIGGVFDAPDPVATARALRALFDQD